MAFDYGSIDLGIKNPFKKEGTINTIRGIIVFILSIYLLLRAAGQVEENVVTAWISFVFGIVLLTSGISTISSGIIAMVRYFVGRSQPTSLARNFSQTELRNSKEEEAYTAYNEQELTEMLVGRKNPTFIEPKGMLARVLHSFFPSLTYMPYPVRNLAQSLFGAWIKTIVSLISYGLVAFVSLAGFAGEIGKQAMPIYSVLLVLYLILLWRNIGLRINNLQANKGIYSLNRASLARTIVGAILIPVLIGVGLQLALKQAQIPLSKFIKYADVLPKSHTTFYLLAIFIGALVSSTIILIMLSKRLKYADPKVEVSELRENWQESVHPKEIFINLDNLVMANRRYKEVPNRVYQELNPILNEQVKGKGSFFGEMIQEIQPKFRAMTLGAGFYTTRFISLIMGNLMLLAGSVLTLFLAFNVAEAYPGLYNFFQSKNIHLSIRDLKHISILIEPAIHLFLATILIRAFANMLTKSAHLFFAEMQFESNLIYFKMEGTFTESRISTGAGIYDSTRSENTLVRSSITPWVIVSKIITSTFAASGLRNLEHPRYIMEMHKDDNELAEIRKDVVNFLKDRESIASITSERDLNNASQIHQINQQSRLEPRIPLKEDEEAAGYLRQSDQKKTNDNNED